MSHNFSTIQAGSIMPIPGNFLGNDSSHNFALLGDDFLDAAKCLKEQFQNISKPVYLLAFQALELFLKSYLLSHGATLHDVKYKIGHKLHDALAEARAQGLILSFPTGVEDAVMRTSEYYTGRDFQYRNTGEWEVVRPDVLIAFVETVCMATGNLSRLPNYRRPRKTCAPE